MHHVVAYLKIYRWQRILCIQNLEHKIWHSSHKLRLGIISINLPTYLSTVSAIFIIHCQNVLLLASIILLEPQMAVMGTNLWFWVSTMAELFAVNTHRVYFYLFQNVFTVDYSYTCFFYQNVLTILLFDCCPLTGCHRQHLWLPRCCTTPFTPTLFWFPHCCTTPLTFLY